MADQIFPEPTVGVFIFNQAGELLLLRSHKWPVCRPRRACGTGQAHRGSCGAGMHTVISLQFILLADDSSAIIGGR
jgi:hypothetical protein